ncbi:MAG: RluA family pseudouridine synthase [Ilumatobacteraceae bacterium]
MISEEIPAALAGERIDRVVALVTQASRADAAGLIEAAAVTVDGEVATSGKVRVREGQRIVVDETKLPVPPRPAADPSVAVHVVHADDDVIVVDKQAGLVVHPGAGHPDGTLVNGLLALFPEIATVGEPHRPGIVHRLDVGTSGLLVVARSQPAYASLVEALAAHRVERTYRTLVWGTPPNPNGMIDALIGRDHRDPTRMAVVVDGRPARTEFRVLRTYDRPAELSALRCQLQTGRTHQIRVHLAAIGHPVVGDGTYGGVRDVLEVPRPFLHAAEVALRHPITHEALQFGSPLPPDLAAVESDLDRLR